MKRLVLLLLSLSFIISCKDQPEKNKEEAVSSISEIITDSITSRLDSLYTIGRIQGFGVAISDSTGTLYSKGFGMMDEEYEKLYSDKTIQNIASISKTFIGIALMKAQEEGALKLDEPINKYLPFEVINPHFPSNTITIRQLANHTSSIRDTDVYDQKSYVLKEAVPDSLLKGVEETFNPPESKIPFIEFLPEILVREGKYYTDNVFLEQKPGARFEYSNIGATLAALVLEMATEVPFDEYTGHRILEPLGMNASGWSYKAIDLQNHSQLYANRETVIPMYELITYPDGGLRSSTLDMSVYLSELIKGYYGQGTLLSAESYKEYFNPTLDDSHFEEERNVEFPYNDEYNMGDSSEFFSYYETSK